MSDQSTNKAPGGVTAVILKFLAMLVAVLGLSTGWASLVSEEVNVSTYFAIRLIVLAILLPAAMLWGAAVIDNLRAVNRQLAEND